jgi:tubulin polyglutamylase TTLL6/13
MIGLQQYVCQVYLHQPLLIDGYKFDMRIYTLITSCDPLRIYIFNEGIARFATQRYSPPSVENAQNVFMHLTNYSINKYSCEFLAGEKGSKRRTSNITAWLTAQGFDAHLVWNEVDDVIIKTVITAAETLKREYKMCFPR